MNKITNQRAFGVFVKQRREDQDYGLRELARKVTAILKGRGMSVSYLNAIEKGRRAPPPVGGRPHVRSAMS